MSAPVAVGRVLPTLNEDGTRRWLRPKPATGAFWRRRRAVAYVLMLLFLAIPHIRIRGKPAILLDVVHRRFTLFGYAFLATDTLLFMLLLASIIISVFLLTALFGRVWCGWGCPQTVYMEFLFRPLERWIEGGPNASRQLDRHRQYFAPRRLLTYVVFAGISLLLAHTFLAYFVGVDQIVQWVRLPPSLHPTSFAVMAVTSGLVFLDFTYFREQTCTIACPYGRWQSVLLDKSSLIVAYDHRRGEPRAKGKTRPAGTGDCVDCGACVLTCPTGIDIRDGLQMECIHCTQCADACDAIMDSVGKPRGLIRYSSLDQLAGKPKHLWRPRTVLYPSVLALSLGSFLVMLGTRAGADVTLLRPVGVPFTLQDDGRVANQVQIKIANRSNDLRSYRITLLDATEAQLVAPMNPLTVALDRTEMTSVFVVLPRSAFQNGERRVRLRIADGVDFDETFPFMLVGPEDEHGQREGRTGTPERGP